MLVVMSADATPSQVSAVTDKIHSLGFTPQVGQGGTRTVIVISGNHGLEGREALLRLPGVEDVVRTTPPYKLAARDAQSGPSTFPIAGTRIGGGCTLIAGPCSVENERMLMETAAFMTRLGIKLLRAGAYKPRTSPYSFQGLGEAGLRLLAKVKEQTGIGIVTEVLDAEAVARVEEVADVLQVGTRNMQNTTLLRRLGTVRRPVLLKRGMAATVDEWLLAAEYVLAGGNPRVILCERGIRTAVDHAYATLDLGVVPIVKQRSHLPIIVDPSHGTGRAAFVPAMSRAALAAGADGLLIEVHPDPVNARSDGQQSLTFDEFEQLHHTLRSLAEVLGVALL